MSKPKTKGRTAQEIITQQNLDANAQTAQVANGQDNTGNRDRSPRSGTQLLESNPRTGEAPPVIESKISTTEAIKHFEVCALAACASSLTAIYAGASALYFAAYVHREADLNEVFGTMRERYAESGLRKSQQYEYLDVAKKLGVWLKKNFDQGGPVQDMCACENAAQATAVLANFVNARMKPHEPSIPRLKIIMQPSAEWTVDKQAAFIASQTEEAKQKAKKSRQSREHSKVAKAVAVMRPTVVLRILQRAQPIEQIAAAFAQTIGTPDECNKAVEILLTRRNTLITESGTAPGEHVPAGEPAARQAALN